VSGLLRVDLKWMAFYDVPRQQRRTNESKLLGFLFW